MPHDWTKGSTRAWRQLRAQVIAEEPTCWLQLDGCTHVSTTADHVIPRSRRPDLWMERSNLRGACLTCNTKRGNDPPPEPGEPAALGWFD